MKNINKQLGASVKRSTRPLGMFNNKNKFSNVDGVYTYSQINLKNFGQIDDNLDFQKKVMEKVKSLKSKEGYRINESIDDDTLSDQINSVQIEANTIGENALKYANVVPPIGRDKTINNAFTSYVKNGKSDFAPLNPFFDAYLLANALHVTAESMRKEIELRQNIGEKIDMAIKTGDLQTMKEYEKLWRTNDQKQKLMTAISGAQVLADKQKKIDELNSQLANAKTAKEKDAIANQISSLMGSVSTQTGVPKGLIYVGIGMAVIVGVWITIRAIRKD